MRQNFFLFHFQSACFTIKRLKGVSTDQPLLTLILAASDLILLLSLDHCQVAVAHLPGRAALAIQRRHGLKILRCGRLQPSLSPLGTLRLYVAPVLAPESRCALVLNIGPISSHFDESVWILDQKLQESLKLRSLHSFVRSPFKI